MQPVLLQLRAVHLEELHVDDDFRACLVDGGEHARRRGDALRRVLDRERVGGRRRRDAPRVEDHAQQIHRFLEVRVAQVERAHDFFFILAALGRRIRDDDDGFRRGHAKEGARRPGDGTERVVERGIPQVDGNGGLAECRIENQADVGEARDGCEHVAAARVAERERRGHLHALRQVEAGRRQVARSLDDRLKLGLAFASHRHLRTQFVARGPQLVVHVAVARVQLRRDLELHQRLVQPARGREPAAPCEMVASRAFASSGCRRTAFVYSTTATS